MKTLNRNAAEITSDRPIKVLQFGTGNFLRGFADWIIDLLNEKTDFNGDIQLVQVHGKKPAAEIEHQDGLYHVLTRGFSQGKTIDESRLITCVKGAINPYLDYEAYLKLAENPDLEWIISNTTEAGIYVDEADKSYDETPNAFPGKLTVLLYQRFLKFGGDSSRNIHILPCELIENNGEKLKEAVNTYAEKWGLPKGFESWLDGHVHYYNTLVDRIVPGYPRDEAGEIEEKLGYKDDLMVVAEPFHFWAIQGPPSLDDLFPASRIGLNVLVVEDLVPYRTRKVRILNGAHTALVPLAYLKGLRIVKDAVEDEEMAEFLREVLYEEIIPSLDMPKDELEKFASDVMDRFKNPFIRHQLSAIALNSISKFSVRVLPSMLGYIKKEKKLPPNLTKSLAALLVFYRGHYRGETLPVNDTEEVMQFFSSAWASGDPYDAVPEILAKTSFWGQDLNQYAGLSDRVIKEVSLLLLDEKTRIV